MNKIQSRFLLFRTRTQRSFIVSTLKKIRQTLNIYNYKINQKFNKRMKSKLQLLIYNQLNTKTMKQKKLMKSKVKMKQEMMRVKRNLPIMQNSIIKTIKIMQLLLNILKISTMGNNNTPTNTVVSSIMSSLSSKISIIMAVNNIMWHPLSKIKKSLEVNSIMLSPLCKDKKVIKLKFQSKQANKKKKKLRQKQTNREYKPKTQTHKI